MRTEIDLNALADLAEEFDCHPDYEDDAFVAEFMGERLYVERKARAFLLHIGEERLRLPRC